MIYQHYNEKLVTTNEVIKTIKKTIKNNTDGQLKKYLLRTSIKNFLGFPMHIREVI
ncbi:hypothetical protein [Mycoplasmopsis cynos]|uniref:hypothetical protein n=1 Tax=Mycoplasmopsis cynos TaxID=171284 RepID=UPI00220CB970|nr:hypothetical protein [Mycoplasmopsis cynos]UWV83087.1 hypothetical protein NW067_02285 [Mycoplasmopsis cynos]UWV93189.1 hypothetical protein NW062_04005 [Mycoplasmopsis cynos]